MATRFQNGINAWQCTCCQSLLSVCGPVALLITGRAGSIDHCLWKALDLNIWTSCWEYHKGHQHQTILPSASHKLCSRYEQCNKIKSGFSWMFSFFLVRYCADDTIILSFHTFQVTTTSYFNSNDFWSWWQIVLKWPKVFIAAFYWFLC